MRGLGTVQDRPPDLGVAQHESRGDCDGDDGGEYEEHEDAEGEPGAACGEQQRHGDDGREFADGTVHQNGFTDGGAHDTGLHEDRQKSAQRGRGQRDSERDVGRVPHAGGPGGSDGHP